jgi:hypothetical protein
VDAGALPDGIKSSCAGCHGGGAEITIALDPPEFEPGDTVRLDVTIAGGAAQTGGVFIEVNAGELSALQGQGLSVPEPEFAYHFAPKPASGGRIQFSLDYHAPAEPAAIRIEAFGVSANNNGNRSGDSAGESELRQIVGCLGETFYRDFDGDGFGVESSGTTVDCAPPPGYALEDGDCADTDPERYPGRAEVCNSADDDCDGEIDERAAPTCGLGMCRREAYFCAEDALCEPGLPSEETCNLLDDDCDGMIDRGDICDGGLVCHLGDCKVLELAMAEDPSFIPYRGFPELGFASDGSPGEPFVPGMPPVSGTGGAAPAPAPSADSPAQPEAPGGPAPGQGPASASSKGSGGCRTSAGGSGGGFAVFALFLAILSNRRRSTRPARRGR